MPTELVYPANLPTPQTAPTRSDERRLIAAGRPFASRSVQRQWVATRDVTWPPLTLVQATALRDFVRDDLEHGGNKFSATWPLPMGQVPATYRLLTPIRKENIQARLGYYRCTAQVEVTLGPAPVVLEAPLWHWRFENSGNAGSINFTPDNVTSDGGDNSFAYTPQPDNDPGVPAIFGEFSGLFNGANNHLTSSAIPDDWRQFGLMDFTLEGYDTGEGDIICTGSYGASGHIIGPDPTSGQLALSFNRFVNGLWLVEYSTAIGSGFLDVYNPAIPGTTPRHWAIVNDSTSLRLYVAGVKHLETLGMRPFVAPYIAGQMFIVGARYTGGGAGNPVFLGDRYSGLMDEFRMCRAALYTGDTFTPPTGPLPSRF